MIYLFSNERFGLAFRRTARKLCGEHKVSLIIVASARYRKRGTVRGWLDKVRNRWSIITGRCLNGFVGYVAIVQVADVNSREFLKNITPADYGVVAGFNQIFSENSIGRFKRIVNFHPSVLPLYRGPIPSYWCLLNKERKTGFTLHVITSKIDCGPILYQDVVAINDNDDESNLDIKISNAAQGAFDAYLCHLIQGKEFISRKIDATQVYATPVDYAGFP